ncbi:MAG TPA: hypothetical protein VFS00_26355 [Polyangiaceae bacterium]|nr:hypothetical protein [Polyangiaceae bacterium]
MNAPARLAPLFFAALALASPAGAASPGDLAGDWVVDLRSKLDAPAYTKAMLLTVAADGAVTGSFYDSTIEAGRAAVSKGRTCVAFRTSDGKAPYHSSGCLVGERIEGQTWSEGRNFLMTWTAVRKAK